MTDDPMPPPPPEPRRAAALEHSWRANAGAWAYAVREGAIASRRLATDAAILDALLERRPARVLDVGCGEGWLVRALAAHGIRATGVDASPELVDLARDAGGGDFLLASYAELVRAPETVEGHFDGVVCNFSLLDEDPAPLLRALRSRLAPGGALLIQTLHPWSAADGHYRDGWRVERFRGLQGFREPMPWFFRTLASWFALLHGTGFRVVHLREPAHPDAPLPLSLLLTAEPAP